MGTWSGKVKTGKSEWPSGGRGSAIRFSLHTNCGVAIGNRRRPPMIPRNRCEPARRGSRLRLPVGTHPARHGANAEESNTEQQQRRWFRGRQRCGRVDGSGGDKLRTLEIHLKITVAVGSERSHVESRVWLVELRPVETPEIIIATVYKVHIEEPTHLGSIKIDIRGQCHVI